MARIKIKDLPKDKKVSKAELKKIFGGLTLTYSTQSSLLKPPLQSPLQSPWGPISWNVSIQ